MTIRFSIKKVQSRPDRTAHILTNNTRVPVYVRIRDGRNVDQTVRTNILVNPMWWNSVKEEVRAASSCMEEERLCINLEIFSLRNSLVAKYVADKALVGIEKDWLKRELSPDRTKIGGARTLDNMFMEFIAEQNISDPRREQYLQALRLVGRYDFYRKKLLGANASKQSSPSEMDRNWVAGLEKFILNEHTMDQEAGTKRQRPHSQNTTNDILKKLRSFFKWCVEKEYLDKSPFEHYRIGSDLYGTPVCLTGDEVTKVARANLPTVHLRRQRDIFVFQCNVGCRVGDLLRLKEKDCEDGYISYIPTKTIHSSARAVTVPLNRTALQIIDRYRGKCGGKLLPFISVQKYNEAIKTVLRLAGVTRQVAVLDPLTRAERKVAICDVSSSHTARRTFINKLYHKVKDPTLISSLTGHKEGSMAFQRYREIDIALKRELVEMLEE